MLVAPRSQGLLDQMTKVIGPMVDTEVLGDMDANAKDPEDLGGVENVAVEQADEPTPAVVVQEHSKQRKYRQKPPSGIQYMLHWLIPESLQNQSCVLSLRGSNACVRLRIGILVTGETYDPMRELEYTAGAFISATV